LCYPQDSQINFPGDMDSRIGYGFSNRNASVISPTEPANYSGSCTTCLVIVSYKAGVNI